MEAKAEIAIVGGSGVYDTTMFESIKEVEIDTPFGRPSDSIVIGSLGELKIAFLPRHGKGHRLSPGRLNSRANIYALKKLEVTAIISASAVGSLKEELKPLDIVIPDQIYDRTRLRESTFFSEDVVVHIGMADPFCPALSRILAETAAGQGYRVHPTGTYVCIEGPQFSTRAESRVYQNLGFDIIGMTALPEAKLAREAEICYTILATVTDYDVWKEEDVTIETVLENVAKNETAVKNIIREILPKIPPQQKRECRCSSSLKGAIITDPAKIPVETKRRLELLTRKYLK